MRRKYKLHIVNTTNYPYFLHRKTYNSSIYNAFSTDVIYYVIENVTFDTNGFLSDPLFSTAL